MTNEEAAKTLSLHLMQCCALMPIDWIRQNGEGSRLQEAMRMALDALNQEPEKNEPLSIKELVEMDGQPAWCEGTDCWGIVTVDSSGQWGGIPFLLGPHFNLNIERRDLKVYRHKTERQELD